jgi:hypothetical protein
MLYIFEAKSAVMKKSGKLNDRLKMLKLQRNTMRTRTRLRGRIASLYLSRYWKIVAARKLTLIQMGSYYLQTGK